MYKLFLILSALLLSSCVHYGPNAPTPAQLTTASPFAGILASYNALPDGPAKIVARNDIITNAKAAYDVQYTAFKNSFLAGQAYMQTGVGLATLGLSLGGGAVSSLGTAKILSLISGGLNGGYGIYQANTYANVTRWALVAKMKADMDADEVILAIDMGTNSGVTLEQAILDLEKYALDGNLDNAIMEIIGSAAASSQASREALRQMREHGGSK